MVGRMWREVLGWARRRPAALPLLVLGALIIAVASGPSPAEGSWTGLPDAAILRWALVGIVLGLATLGFLILLMTRTVPTPGEAKRRSWVTTVGAILLVAALLSLIDVENEPQPLEEAEELPLVETTASGPQVDPGPGFETGDLTALLVILAAAVFLLVWTRRRSNDVLDDELDDERSAMGAALARARDHLIDGDDPRQAVLLAYRNLEQTLESLDLPRRQTETPTEHLTRAIGALSIDDPEQADPLLQLAGLYARARYSEHRITVTEQRRAGESLGRARRRLVGAD